MSSLPPPLKPDQVQLLLVGGPCNGALQVVTDKAATAGRVRCGGATYVPDPRDVNWPPHPPYATVERWIPNWAAAEIVGGNPPKVPHSVGAAWHRLMRVFAHTGPESINRMRRAAGRMERLRYKLTRR